MSTEIPIHILNIEEDGIHLLIHVEVNGKPAKMIIDTGASQTVFDINRIHQFIDDSEFEENETLSTGLGTNTMKSLSVNIEELKLGKLALRDYKTVLLDLTHVNQTYEQLEMEAIDGVLGSDLLLAKQAVINYKDKLLKLL